MTSKTRNKAAAPSSVPPNADAVQPSSAIVQADEVQQPVSLAPDVDETQTDDTWNVPKAIRVVSQIDGFRRGGRAWSKAPTDVSFDDLTEEQLKQILAEPLLTVVFIGG